MKYLYSNQRFNDDISYKQYETGDKVFKEIRNNNYIILHL